MREHHALGISGRAARVDDRRQVLAGNLGLATANLVVFVGAAAALHQAVPGEDLDLVGGRDDRIERDEKLEVGQRFEHVEDFVGLLLTADDDAARLAVANLVLDLTRSERSVQRHVGRSRGKDRLVGDQPLVAIFRKDGDPVAWVHTQLDEPRRRAVGHPAVVCPSEIVVQAVPLKAHGRPRAQELALAAMHVGEIRKRHQTAPPLASHVHATTLTRKLQKRWRPPAPGRRTSSPGRTSNLRRACGAKVSSRSGRRWRPADARVRSRRPGD